MARPPPAAPAGRFLYFSFGSNLSRQRIHINSPSAEFVTVATLPGYVMRFCGHSRSWNGGTATICEEEEGEVWGAVWRISNGHLKALDRQEARYRRLHVNVSSTNGEELKCLTYQLKEDSYTATAPSPLYLETVLAGAREHRLPDDYVEKLSHTKHNGYTELQTIPGIDK